MLKVLRESSKRFWAWLAEELPEAEIGTPAEPGPGQFVYVVQTGDTIASIARRFSTSVWLLADLNELDDPGLIRAGQQLLIPRPGAPGRDLSPGPTPEAPVESESGPFIYIVQTGDTLTAIARRFSLPVAVVVETNHIQGPNQIWPGQRLFIPAVDLPPESSPAPASKSAPEPKPTQSEPAPLPLPESAPESPPLRTPEPAPEREPLPGQHLYVVQPGDTMMSIARRFNVTLRAIIEANHIEDPNLIQADQRLIIPGISLPLAPTSAPQPGLTQRTPLGGAGTSHLEGTSRPGDTPSLPGALLSPIPWPNDAIRGIYVSYFAIGQQEYRRHIIDLLTKTEINALVIDVKGDYGLVSYPTGVALAHDIGAAQPTAHDFEELMDFFKANGVYTIARIVTFKDDPFANAHPEQAAQREGGGLWHSREGLAWTDPFAHAVWEYNADLAEEAARRGFDEIQFDYVRFPTQSQEGTPYFSQSLSRESRVAAISGFLSYVRGRLVSLGVSVAADVFGYACWRKDDTLIGQDIGRMAQYLDVLCPMLYPSTFQGGIPGYKYAIAHPYETVYESMKRAVHQVEALGCRVRPWIQDFPDYAFDKRAYGAAEIRAQMRGSFDGGGVGYMAWDPRIKYTTEAYFQGSIRDFGRTGGSGGEFPPNPT